MSEKNTYKANEQIYRKIWSLHVSSKQLVKFLPSSKSKLHHNLQSSNEGLKCLKYMAKIKSVFLKRDNDMFVSTIDMLGRHLENNPLLIPYFPIPLLNNIKRIRKKGRKKNINVIYLTKYHRLCCAGCSKSIVGNKVESKSCDCSLRFYHRRCYNVVEKKKCAICMK